MCIVFGKCVVYVCHGVCVVGLCGVCVCVCVCVCARAKFLYCFNFTNIFFV